MYPQHFTFDANPIHTSSGDWPQTPTIRRYLTDFHHWGPEAEPVPGLPRGFLACARSQDSRKCAGTPRENAQNSGAFIPTGMRQPAPMSPA